MFTYSFNRVTDLLATVEDVVVTTWPVGELSEEELDSAKIIAKTIKKQYSYSGIQTLPPPTPTYPPSGNMNS